MTRSRSLALLVSLVGCAPAAEPPPQTPVALEEPRPRKAEPAPCLDGFEIVLRAPSRAGFAPGIYEIEVDFEGQERVATCEIRTNDEDSSCQPLGNVKSAFSAALARNGQSVSLLVTAHPESVDLDVRRDKVSIARSTISPRYEPMQASDGTRCTTAFVALGLR